MIKRISATEFVQVSTCPPLYETRVTLKRTGRNGGAVEIRVTGPDGYYRADMSDITEFEAYALAELAFSSLLNA